MKAAGFVGSPRLGGNTQILVERVLAGAATAGAKTEVYRLIELNIRSCQACNYCQEHGRCRQNDDMTPLHEAFVAAGGIVVASDAHLKEGVKPIDKQLRLCPYR